MKKILNVTLIENTNKQEFVDSFDKETQADFWNMLGELPTLICMNVEESFISEFKNDARVVLAEERPVAYPAALPATYTMTKNITGVAPVTTENGANYAPLQFYYDTNQIQSQDTVGSNVWTDTVDSIYSATYSTRWTGKNVDIVTIESGYGEPPSVALQGIHNTHPDFKDPDNLSASRVVAMNWTDLEDAANNQITSNRVFASHAMGVLSAAAGTVCGFAKKANLRASYLTNEDGDIEVINAIISWHNSKTFNPTTLVKNPTIVIGEWQYLQDRKKAIKIDDILSITTQQGVVNRPGASWGSDFTPFTERNIIPFQVYNVSTTTYEWRIVFPTQSQYSSLQTAVTNLWNAGIIFINAAGNNGGVYTKIESAFQTYCTTSANPQVITITYDIANSAPTTEGVTTWYNFVPYGPHGVTNAIDVAAGQNSEASPILDAYTNRGPGIDIVGLGANTWTAYPAKTYADGSWGMFSGTSCATPTVVGKAACLMEEYFTYNNVWPTPAQTKSILLSEAKRCVEGVVTTTWNNVSNASITISSKESKSKSLARITNGAGANGAYQFTELAGTTNLRAFINASEFNTSNTKGKRPFAGVVYPRPNLKIGNELIIDKLSIGPIPTVSITVTSTAFVTGGSIPLANRAISAGGSNTSPQLSWSVTGSTSDVAYYEVYAEESISPYPILWDVTAIPVGTTSIVTNGDWPVGTTINTIDALQRSNGYYGPRPTANTGVHTYFYTVAAVHSNGSYLGAGLLSGIINTNTPQTYALNLSVVGGSSSNYTISGSHRSGSIASGTTDPAIVVNTGDTLNFVVASGAGLASHPFWIKTTAVTGTGSGVTTGTVSGQGRTTTGTTSWNTTGVTPGTYHYICQNHGSMTGTITVRAATA